MKKTLIAITLASLIGCSSYQIVALPLPLMGELPKITPVEVQCLTDETYDKLRRRDILQENHIDKLEGVINSTH